MNQELSYSIPISDLYIHDASKSHAGTPFSSRSVSDEAPEVLERYFNDLYKLFLNKLTQFDSAASVSFPEKKKLKSLLDELIYVKALLEQKK